MAKPELQALQEFILRCDLEGNITQVVSETGDSQLSARLPVSVTSLFEPESLDVGLQFIKEIQTFGRSENFSISMRLSNVAKKFNCSGVTLSKQIFISGVEASTVLQLPASKTVSFSSENALPVEADTTIGYEEMFEELSRLNNELINAKRELIRKNKELERFQVLLKKDKTVS